MLEHCTQQGVQEAGEDNRAAGELKHKGKPGPHLYRASRQQLFPTV